MCYFKQRLCSFPLFKTSTKFSKKISFTTNYIWTSQNKSISQSKTINKLQCIASNLRVQTILRKESLRFFTWFCCVKSSRFFSTSFKHKYLQLKAEISHYIYTIQASCLIFNIEKRKKTTKNPHENVKSASEWSERWNKLELGGFPPW